MFVRMARMAAILFRYRLFGFDTLRLATIHTREQPLVVANKLEWNGGKQEENGGVFLAFFISLVAVLPI